MKKFFKWFGIVLGSLLVLLVIVLAVFYFKGNAMLSQTYNIPSRKYRDSHRCRLD